MMLLLFLSGYFYLERMTQMDSAFASLRIINEGRFIAPHYRYPVILTQIFPILFSSLNLPIKWVLFSYSMNFYVLYTLCFIASAFWFKQTTTALAIPLLLVFISRELFYIQTELLEGLVFAITFLSYLRAEKHNRLSHGIGWLSAIFAVLLHPISNVLIVFTLCYHFATSKKPISQSVIVIGIMALVWFVVKASLLPDNEYEQSFYREASHLGNKLLLINGSYFAQFFLSRMSTLFLPIILVFFMSMILLVFHKSWLVFLLVLVSIVGYFVGMSLVIKGDSNAMMERSYLGIGFIMSLVFVDELHKFFSSKQPLSWVLVVLVVIGLGFNNIIDARVLPQKHLTQSLDLATRLQQNPGSKFYTLRNNIPFANEYVMWPIACEQLLLSGIYFPQNPKSIYLLENEQSISEIGFDTLNQNITLLAPFFFRIPNTFFNPYYYPFSPEKYQYLQPFKEFYNEQSSN